MLNLRRLMAASVLVAFAVGCGTLPDTVTINISAPTQPSLGDVVQSTLQALTARAPANPSVTPSPTNPAAVPAFTGSISGTLQYPADSLPAMYVAAFLAGSQMYSYVITNPGQPTYQIDGLAPGNYHVIAYTVGGGGFPAGLAGGYTQAVPCGLGTNCTDHSLIDVQVEAGQTQSGIAPKDWYAPNGTFPPFPQQVGSAGTPTASAGNLGAISGQLMYPASNIPSLRIVAFRVDGSAFYYLNTNLGQSTYQLGNLPVGTYHVVAYPLPGGGFSGGAPGGYSQMVPCGLQAGCTDHTLIDVVVTADHVTGGVDPNDFYANPGSFPPDPVP